MLSNIVDIFMLHNKEVFERKNLLLLSWVNTSKLVTIHLTNNSRQLINWSLEQLNIQIYSRVNIEIT